MGPVHEAVLLIGPTGVGKTPLGELLAERGWRGRRAWHFDFGAWLRRAYAGEVTVLAESEVDFIGRVLSAGALLEDDRFALAESIFRFFLEERGAAAGDLVVLNGLPRHLSQARDVDGLVRVTTLIHLRATPAVVHSRIRSNAGGDRSGRVDDDRVAVERKLALFVERTKPLLEHYREQGAALHEVEVTAQGTSEEFLRQLG